MSITKAPSRPRKPVRGAVWEIAQLRQLRAQREALEAEIAALLADIATLEASIAQMRRRYPAVAARADALRKETSDAP